MFIYQLFHYQHKESSPPLHPLLFHPSMHESQFREVTWPILVANKLLKKQFFSNSFVADFDGFQDPKPNPEKSTGSKTELSEQKQTYKYRLFAGTWNVGGIPPSDDTNLKDWLDSGNDSHDIYVTGFQEVVPLSAMHVLGFEKTISFMKWNSLIRRNLNKYCGRYRCIISKQMVGIMVSVWVKEEVLPFVRHPSVSCVGCGVFGCLGNKGSVSVRFSLHDTTLCIVCCHLASGGREGDELNRNLNVAEIISRTTFPRGLSLNLPATIKHHQIVILIGDLNYRISLAEEETRALVLNKQWDVLLEKDQLGAEMKVGGVFEGWREGAINFLPTYKYDRNSEEYYGSLQGIKRLKKRAPAWCDRIIWHGTGLKQMAYDRCESKHSDHRPVWATFIVEVKGST